MKILILIIFSIITILPCAFGKDDNINIYVSPTGNDSNPGTKNLPLLSLDGAKSHVRKIKSSTKSNIVVWFRGGVYKLNKTVVFGLEDSGEGESTITYAAYPNEKPVFSSGKKINGWKKVTTELPGLPEIAKGKVWVANVSDRFLTLYDDKGLLPRARSNSFIPLKGGNKNELYFPKGRLKNWSNIKDVEIFIRPTRDWIVNILPLASVDEKAGIARTAVEATYAMVKKDCWVENVLEELDKPGEWVLNTKEGKVYLWPRNNLSVVAPQLPELIRVEGKIDKKGPTDIPVRNLCFRGLTFMHGERYTLSQNDAGLQHDWDMLDKNNALIRFRGTENCAIEQCHFLYSGSGAIRVDLYGKKDEISNNHIEHIGGGGILLCGYGPGTKDVNKKNLIYNNNIHNVGEIYWQSPGIFLWQSGENRVANNLIHHTNYSGLIISGCIIRFFGLPDNREQVRAIRWNEIGKLPKNLNPEDVEPFLHSRNNIIEYNEIHHVMQKLGDGNGIYIRGAGPGNVIRRNYIHNLESSEPKQSAIRTDGGQRDVLIAENLIYKCKSQGMTLKLNNRFENNIIADVIAPRGIYLKIVEGPMNGASNKLNIYYSSLSDCKFIAEPSEGKGKVGEDRRGRKPARMKDIDSDMNIYYCKANKTLGENIVKRLQKEGVDFHSLSSDPLFVDPEHGDFRLRPESPALKLGFIPFDMSKVGLQDN